MKACVYGQKDKESTKICIVTISLSTPTKYICKHLFEHTIIYYYLYFEIYFTFFISFEIYIKCIFFSLPLSVWDTLSCVVYDIRTRARFNFSSSSMLVGEILVNFIVFYFSLYLSCCSKSVINFSKSWWWWSLMMIVTYRNM